MVSEKKARGEKVVVVDLAGGASAKSIGADVTIGAILTPVSIPNVDRASDRAFAIGNFLTHDGLNHLKYVMDEAGAPVSVVFFRPIAAAEPHEQNIYSIEECPECCVQCMIAWLLAEKCFWNFGI